MTEQQTAHNAPALDVSTRLAFARTRAAYERTGRFTLAGMSVLGWGVGLLFALPRYGLALLVAFISGAIIMNSTIMELPSEKDGRFLAFMAGLLGHGGRDGRSKNHCNGCP